MTLREQFIKSELESCRHFNGIQNKTCSAGVAYQNSKELTMPCIPKFINGRETWACDRFEIMSREDAEKEADERILSVERTSNARMLRRMTRRPKASARGTVALVRFRAQLAPLARSGTLWHRTTATCTGAAQRKDVCHGWSNPHFHPRPQ
jgi:hypothetical protein